MYVKKDLSPWGIAYLSDWIWNNSMGGQCRRSRRTTRAAGVCDATAGVNLDVMKNVSMEMNEK